MGPVRRFGVAWLRVAAAIHLIGLALASPILVSDVRFGLELASMLATYLSVLATPLVLARGLIVRETSPYLRPGYALASAYPVVVVLAISGVEAFQVGPLVVMTLLFQPFALGVIGLQLPLKRWSERWLGAADAPRAFPRGMMIVLLVGFAAVYAPFVGGAIAADRCLDRGGRVGDDGRCEMGR